MTKRLVVAISGSSGVILGIRLLEALHELEVETHLVLTAAARLTIEQETGWRPEDVEKLANFHYSPRDIGAVLASGSFQTDGMVVIPCSIKSLSSIANSYAADLLTRAADVTLKEGRPLVLVVREAPFHRGHLRLMERAAAAGAVIFPPVPAFYGNPQTVDELVDGIVGRVLLRLGIENNLYARWEGSRSTLEGSRSTLEGPHSIVLQGWPPGEFLALPAMTLATSGPGGVPHAATVYFAANAQGGLVFFSEPDSQHILDLQANPQAAAAIHPLVSGYQDIRGLQMRGVVRQAPPGPEWEAAWQAYQAKFPFVSGLKELVMQNTLYVFQPNWIRLVDNRRGFGYKEEKTLP